MWHYLESTFQKIKDVTMQDNQVYVMREDLLPLALGGNKVRIAESFLLDMERKGCDVMIAYGNVRSNLCRVLAIRCFEKKIPCYIICSGNEEKESAAVNANSRVMQLLNSRMIYCRTDQIAETVEHTIKMIEADGHKPYYIYGNKYGTGNEWVSAAAYANAYEEIIRYQKEQNITFDYIFHASGTGATQTGLTCGHILAKDHTQIMGVSISSRTYERAYSIIVQGMQEYFEHHNLECSKELQQEIHLLSEYTKGGYGVYDEEVLVCIKNQLRENSLPLDPVYTGKAFLGMEKYLKKQNISGKNILFIHTGGTPLFYDCLSNGELT